MYTTRKPAPALMLALILMLLCVPASAQETRGAEEAARYLINEIPASLPAGVSVSRTEEDGFDSRLEALLLSLTAPAEAESDRPEAQADGAEALYESLTDTLPGALAASRLNGEEDFLFALTPGSDAEAAAVGTGCEGRFLNLFLFGPDAASQAVFTEWGFVIGQSNPAVGTVRPDGSFAVLAAGETRIVLMDSRTMDVLDAFTLTVLPEGVEGELSVAASGADGGEMTLQVGQTAQLTALLDAAAANSPLSCVERTPDASEDAILPEALMARAAGSAFAPSVQPDASAQPLRCLKIPG